MAGDRVTAIAKLVRDGTFVRLTGLCWRAVPTGGEQVALRGSIHSGRYNRPGQPTLYMSASPEGVAAAMARYGEAERTLVPLRVAAERLIDLRCAAASDILGIDVARAREDWLFATERGMEAPSWAVSDQARAIGADGLIDRSRHAPGEWHLVLFRWNEGLGPMVTTERADRAPRE